MGQVARWKVQKITEDGAIWFDEDFGSCAEARSAAERDVGGSAIDWDNDCDYIGDDVNVVTGKVFSSNAALRQVSFRLEKYVASTQESHQVRI